MLCNFFFVCNKETQWAKTKPIPQVGKDRHKIGYLGTIFRRIVGRILRQMAMDGQFYMVMSLKWVCSSPDARVLITLIWGRQEKHKINWIAVRSKLYLIIEDSSEGGVVSDNLHHHTQDIYPHQWKNVLYIKFRYLF